MKSSKYSFLTVSFLLGALCCSAQVVAVKHGGQVRTYYIAADEVDWDYRTARYR